MKEYCSARSGGPGGFNEFISGRTARLGNLCEKGSLMAQLMDMLLDMSGAQLVGFEHADLDEFQPFPTNLCGYSSIAAPKPDGQTCFTTDSGAD